MPKGEYPTISYLRQVVSYNPDSGEMIWLARDASMFNASGSYGPERVYSAWKTKFEGKAAFNSDDGKGYYTGRINGHSIFAHRAAYAIMTGEWPEVIDHINGDGKDNRWVNIRNVTQAENLRNRAMDRRNASGMMGVTRPKGRRKWQARIESGGKIKHIGCYDTYEEACAARKAAENMLGFHPNHNQR